MWVAPLLASGTCCVLGVTALIFSRQLQNGKLKPLRAFATLVVCLVVVLWVAASFAAIGMSLSNVVVVFSAVALVGAAVTIWGTVGLHSLRKQLSDVAIVEGFMVHRESLAHSDWLRALMLLMFAPFLPLFLVLSATNQLCRRFFDWIGRTCKVNSAGLPTKPLDEHDRHLWLTAYWQSQLNSVANWPWASVLSKMIYWGAGFLLLVVGVGKVTTVFLSWLNEQLEPLDVGAVVVIFMAVGLTMFLCPVIPGIPVYVTAGLVVTRRAMIEYDFWTGVAIATFTAWAIKMLSVIVQHKLFGERLSTYVYVRSVVAVNSVQTRAMSKILAKPGFTWAKVRIIRARACSFVSFAHHSFTHHCPPYGPCRWSYLWVGPIGPRQHLLVYYACRSARFSWVRSQVLLLKLYAQPDMSTNSSSRSAVISGPDHLPPHCLQRRLPPSCTASSRLQRLCSNRRHRHWGWRRCGRGRHLLGYNGDSGSQYRRFHAGHALHDRAVLHLGVCQDA
jgi:hypothetical protein